MSITEKIIRTVICFIACILVVICFSIVVGHLNLENPVLETFIHVAFSCSIGWLCGNSLNNTLNIPEKKD